MQTGFAAAKLLDSYHEERFEAATQNVHVTNRTARFLRAPDGPERLFRNAAISLAKQYPFARSLINTGRMAVANTYTHSSVCGEAGGTSVQNAAVWLDAGGKNSGTLNDLLNWCEGRFLLLVFGRIPVADVPRLRELAQRLPVRVVQVLGPDALGLRQPVAVEHVYDLKGLLRQATQAQSLQWAVVRPDAYLAGGGRSGPKWRSEVTAVLLKASGAAA